MTADLTPAYDNKITRKYSARTVEHKTENKLALQRELGWIEEAKHAILCVPCALTDAKGGELFAAILPGIMELPLNLVVRGKGAKKYGELLMIAAKEHRHRIGILPDDDLSMRKMLAGTDMSLFVSQEDEGELTAAMRYGCIPISIKRDSVLNYNPVQESGNAFVYENPTVWQCFSAIVRALETFRFPYDWRTIQRHAMEASEIREAALSTR